MSADSLLRPALEAAVAVARNGEGDVPARAAPVGLRPFLNFAKLPPRALVAARKALDADADFRAHVVDEVSEEAVGHAGWLFLVRPEGWEAELDALVRRADDERARLADHRAEDDARRRLGAAEGAARRAEEVAEGARAAAARAAVALAEERQARRAATQEATEIAARTEAVTTERDRARAEAERARADAAAAKADARDAKAALDGARAELATARAEAAAAMAARQVAEAAASAAGRQARGRPAPVVPDVSSDGAEALAAAAHAARALADGLAAAARALGDGSTSRPTVDAPVPERSGRDAGEGPRPRRTRAAVRTAAPLPPAIFEESSEAAEHLARLPGVVILVDGYNVSHAGWPGTPIAEQRRRLVDALAELVARTGADVRVVFDGADTVDPPAVSTTSRTVRVSFSPPDVEADDVIVAEVGEIPAHRPVVVASSDRRVRDESRARGANLLRSSQLLDLLRR